MSVVLYYACILTTRYTLYEFNLTGIESRPHFGACLHLRFALSSFCFVLFLFFCVSLFSWYFFLYLFLCFVCFCSCMWKDIKWRVASKDPYAGLAWKVTCQREKSFNLSLSWSRVWTNGPNGNHSWKCFPSLFYRWFSLSLSLSRSLSHHIFSPSAF